VITADVRDYGQVKEVFVEQFTVSQRLDEACRDMSPMR